MGVISGDITFRFKLIVESMVWLDDLSNPGSLASQQLSKKFEQAVCIRFSMSTECLILKVFCGNYAKI